MNLCTYDWNLASLYAMRTAMAHADVGRTPIVSVYIYYIYIYMHLFDKDEEKIRLAQDLIAFKTEPIHEYEHAYFKNGWIIMALDYFKNLPYLAFLFDSNEKTQVMLYGGAKK